MPKHRFRLDRRTATALLVAMVFFMENLDSTVISTALPAMAADFHTAAAYLSTGVSAYLVALTVFIPVSGWAVDRFGARRIFASAIVVFTGASLLCAASGGLWSFTCARILQGIGGAMMVPVGRLVVLRDTPKEQRVQAIAVLTWPALVAPLLGPPVGGWISMHWRWPWIFILNLPLGILALIASLILIRGNPLNRKPFDTAGFILTGFGFGFFMSGIEAASRGAEATLSIGTSLIGIMLLVVAVRHVRRANHPLFNLSPFEIPTFRVTAFGGSLFRTAIGTAPFLLPLMFQVGFGYSAVESGVLLLWLFAGNLCMKPGTTWIMKQFGFRRVMIVNGMLIVVGFGLCAALTRNTSYWLTVVLLFFVGMTRSMQFTALNTVGFADIPQAQMRDATTLFSVLQQMNAGVGIVIGALSLSVAGLIHGNHTEQASPTDFHLAFWLIAALALVANFDLLHLSADAGQEILR